MRRGDEERDQYTDSFSSVAVTSELALQEKPTLGKLRQLFYLSRTDPQITDSDVRQILRTSLHHRQQAVPEVRAHHRVGLPVAHLAAVGYGLGALTDVPLTFP